MTRIGTQFAKITGNYSNANIYATWQLRSTDTTNKVFKIRLREYLTIAGTATYESTSSTFKLNGTTIKSGSYSYAKGDNLLGYKDIDVHALADGSFPDTEISVYAKSFHFPATTKTAILTSDDIPRMEIGSSIIDINEAFSDPNAGLTQGIRMNVELFENYKTVLKSTINGITYNLLENVEEPQITVYFDELVYDHNKDGDNGDSVLYPLSDLEIAQLIPNDRQINITFTLETYDVDELKGTSSKNYIFQITNGSFQAQPTLDNDIETTTLTGDTTTFISNFSSIIVDSGILESNNGATIEEYIFVRTNEDSIATVKGENSTHIFENPKLNDTFAVSVIDSRDFEVLLGTMTIDNENYFLLDYTIPQFTSLSIERPEQTASYVEVNLNGSFWNEDFGETENTLTLEYRYKLSNQSDFNEWVLIQPTISEDSFSYNGTIENISANLSALFEIRVLDATGSTDLRTNISIPKGKSMFDLGEDYFSWNGELCINDEEVPCFQEDSVEDDGSRNVTLYDSQGNKVFVKNRNLVYNKTGNSISVTTATNQTIATLKVPAGLYLFYGFVNFGANATGVRKISIATSTGTVANTRGITDTRMASNNSSTMSNISTILNVEKETTYYLNVYQNSGSKLTCYGSLRAVRIGDYAEYQAET